MKYSSKTVKIHNHPYSDETKYESTSKNNQNLNIEYNNNGSINNNEHDIVKNEKILRYNLFSKKLIYNHCNVTDDKYNIIFNKKQTDQYKLVKDTLNLILSENNSELIKLLKNILYNIYGNNDLKTEIYTINWKTNTVEFTKDISYYNISLTDKQIEKYLHFLDNYQIKLCKNKYMFYHQHGNIKKEKRSDLYNFMIYNLKINMKKYKYLNDIYKEYKLYCKNEPYTKQQFINNICRFFNVKVLMGYIFLKKTNN